MLGDHVAILPRCLCGARVFLSEMAKGFLFQITACLSPSHQSFSNTRLLCFFLDQTDPNWSNFLYEPRTRQLALIDFGACRSYDAAFADAYLRLVLACAEADRDTILHHSRQLGFLTGEEGQTMLDAHANAAVLVGVPFNASQQPFDFSKQVRAAS